MFPFPKLRYPQVAVATVEAQTGIPLNLNGERHRLRGGEVYRVFPLLSDARTYADHAVKVDPNIECVIFDHTGKSVATVKSEV